MKILFDKETNTITINGDNKRNNVVAGLMLILYFIFSGWNRLSHHSEGIDYLFWIWIITCIFLLYRFIFVVFKTTGQKQIKVSEIEYIKFTKIFKWRSYYIFLRNGKRREVSEKLEPNEYAAMVERCHSFGIDIRPYHYL